VGHVCESNGKRVVSSRALERTGRLPKTHRVKKGMSKRRKREGDTTADGRRKPRPWVGGGGGGSKKGGAVILLASQRGPAVVGGFVTLAERKW